MKTSIKNSLLEIGASTLATRPANGPHSRVVSGSLILLAGSGLVGVANLVYNVAIARLLGPIGFSQATAVYTLLMLMSAVTLSFQIVCTKLIANHEAPAEKAAVYLGLHYRAWGVGIAIGLALMLLRNAISTYLNLPDTTLIVLLALGTVFYVPLGARRGYMQGTYSFRQLAINLLLEGLVRLGGALVLVNMGMGVTGAVLASVAGVVLAYLFAFPHSRVRLAEKVAVHISFREGLQAIVFFAGQVVISNFDIVLVKHFFIAKEAGLYAAVALVGRFVNMCAWSVVNTMFPLSAGARSEDSEGRPVLVTSLLLVLLVLSVVVFGLWMVPDFLWRNVFGAQFEIAGHGAVTELLVLYALTTGVYSFSSVVIAYEMSRKIANTGWVQLAFSGAFVFGIYIFHSTLLQVIVVQLALMFVLLAIVLLPFLRARSRLKVSEVVELRIDGIGEGRKPITENEVIAEFLKNELHHPEFDEYREQFQRVVTQPDLGNTDENSLRRALLFLRRGAMWRELPPDTQWYEVRLTAQDLARIRVFPRAQWRKIATGSFYLNDIVEGIRSGSENDPDDDFFAKLRRLSRAEEILNPTVLLIGINDQEPLTILDGNHRIAAAMLVTPGTVLLQFRFICGFSPRMTECCWYNTNVTTLWRYAKNLVRHMNYDPEADIGRLLQSGS
jgi:Polysaccharide biosynthesis protein